MKQWCSKLCICSKIYKEEESTTTDVNKQVPTKHTSESVSSLRLSPTSSFSSSLSSSSSSPSEYSEERRPQWGSYRTELDNMYTKSSINNETRYIFKKYKTFYKDFFINYYIDVDDPNIIHKIVIFDHYGNDDHKLPKEGWLHHCLYCNLITGRDMIYTQYKEIDVYIQFCDKCAQSYRNNLLTKELIQSVQKDIKKVLELISHNTFYI